MAAVEGLLECAVDGHGAVVTVVGSPGIGKSRLVREVAAMATARGVDVFTAFCESHAPARIPFHVVARLRACGYRRRGAIWTARQPVTDCAPGRIPGWVTPRTVLLFLIDLLGIADPDVALPTIDPDARRRRLTALVNAASLARHAPAVYVIEDAHWIDEAGASRCWPRFLTVIPQTPSLLLVDLPPRNIEARR